MPFYEDDYSALHVHESKASTNALITCMVDGISRMLAKEATADAPGDPRNTGYELLEDTASQVQRL